MTEDDTFRVLTRKPFMELYRTGEMSDFDKISDIVINDCDGFEEDFDSGGWTWQEFVEEYWRIRNGGSKLDK